jgi:hypothetical protein
MPKPKHQGKKLKSGKTPKHNNKVKYSTMTKAVTLSIKDVMFPDRLRIKGRIAANSLITYTSSAIANSYMLINNPIAVLASQNVSGLAWLISGSQSNGTSYAPYSIGIVRQARIEVYAKLVALPNNQTSALVTMFPLAPSTSTNSMSLAACEEQFGRSNILELPLNFDTVTRSKPLITKVYKIWEILGISEEVYMSGYLDYGFGYAGLLSNTPVVYIDLVSGTESASVDSSLGIRVNIIITLEIELMVRNNLIISAPHV